MSDCTGTVFLHSDNEGCLVAFGLLVDDQYEEYETKPLVEFVSDLKVISESGDADEVDLIAMAIRAWMMEKGAVGFEVVDV